MHYGPFVGGMRTIAIHRESTHRLRVVLEGRLPDFRFLLIQADYAVLNDVGVIQRATEISNPAPSECFDRVIC